MPLLSINTGVAAVLAHSKSFGIISENISNSGTVGYKKIEADFKAVGTSTGGKQNSGGVLAKHDFNANSQGSSKISSSNTDLAIIGNGMFVVNPSATPGNNDPYLMTRVGSFVVGEDGKMKNSDGLYLQAWRTDAAGAIVNAGTQTTLPSLETVSLGPELDNGAATENLVLGANLPADVAAGATENTAQTIYDSKGNAYGLQVNWVKGATANTWDYTFALISNPFGAPSEQKFTPVGTSRTMLFDPNGALKGIGPKGGAPTIGLPAERSTETLTISAAQFAANDPGRNVDPSSITIDWGSYSRVSSGMSQVASPYRPWRLQADGFPPASRDGVTVTDDGLVQVQYKNGRTKNVYRIPLANVRAPTELERVVGNAYTITNTSGDLTLNAAKRGGNGVIQGGQLENSTVDMAKEFAQLIVTQKSYNTATRIITTTDEMLQAVTGLKR